VVAINPGDGVITAGDLLSNAAGGRAELPPVEMLELEPSNMT